jgi:hypothetical protein
MKIFRTVLVQEPITVTGPCKAQVRGLLIAGIVGSNPAERIDFRRLCQLCAVWIGTF